MPLNAHRTRLVHLVPLDGRGGVETAARAMAAARDLACDFRLIFIAGRSLDATAPAVRALDARSALAPAAQIAAVRAILSENPDVLVCSLWRSVPAALAVKLLRPRVRLVLFVHASRRVHKPDDWLHRVAAWVADAIWADSRASLAVFPQRVRQDRRVISFMTARLVALPAPVLAPRFVSWGRLHAHKDFGRAIDLIAALHRQGVAARLDHYGADQGEGSALRRCCADHGLTEHVHFHGEIPWQRLREIAEGPSFFLQTSIFEGFSMAVAEAMQLGLVPVVTPVGEIPVYAQDGRSALFVDKENLEGTASRICELLARPAEYDAMRRAAVAAFDDYPLYHEQMCSEAEALAEHVR